MKAELIFDNLTNFKNNLGRQWLLTNGLGGFSSSSVIGAHSRIHQGYLVAPIDSIHNRYMVFSKTNERLVCGSRIYDLTTAQHQGSYASEFHQGNMHQKSFVYDGTARFIYEAGGMRLTKTVAMPYGQNSCVISYTLENNGPAAGVIVTPLVNFRPMGENMTLDGLKEELSDDSFAEINDGETVGFSYIPETNTNVQVSVRCAGASLVKRAKQVDADMQLQEDIDDGYLGLDSNMTPYDFVIEVEAGGVAEASLVCTVSTRKSEKEDFKKLEPINRQTAAIEIQKINERIEKLVEAAGIVDDEFAAALVMASDQFVIGAGENVIAGYPWYEDIGRDALLSFKGLFIIPHRFDEARKLLKSYGSQIKNGLLPLSLSAKDYKAIYGGADVSLLYFLAVYDFLKAVDTKESWEFVEKEIYPVLLEIMSSYRKGTDYGIAMDDDALLSVGGGFDQTTWIEVPLTDMSASARQGKIVEINALWYNALMIMDEISRGIAKRTSQGAEDLLSYAGGCSQLAGWAKESFTDKFWFEEGGYLYDLVSGDFADSTLRPNQLYAICLPFDILESEREKSILKVLDERLFAGLGLVTLPIDHDDFRHDVKSTLGQRGYDYFNGPAWTFLLGGYVRAYIKIHGKEVAKSDLKAVFDSLQQQLFSHGVGSLSEIYQGKKLNVGAGCFAHSAAVAEVLSAYMDLMQ